MLEIKIKCIIFKYECTYNVYIMKIKFGMKNEEIHSIKDDKPNPIAKDEPQNQVVLNI